MGNVGHRGKVNKCNIMNDWMNYCNHTSNHYNSYNAGSPPGEIIIIQTEIQSGVEKCSSTAKQTPKESA
jgi:hypothetical protein